MVFAQSQLGCDCVADYVEVNLRQRERRSIMQDIRRLGTAASFAQSVAEGTVAREIRSFAEDGDADPGRGHKSSKGRQRRYRSCRDDPGPPPLLVACA